LAVEQAVKKIEETDQCFYPLQTVILMTDGIFYDGNAVPKATEGLRAYNALTFAVGVAIHNGDETFGMTPQEIKTQRKQLSAFVNGAVEYFYNIDEAWSGVLDIAPLIAAQLPDYYVGNGNGPKYDRYTWCVFSRFFVVCSYEQRL
jgi:hypothetical protein